jgi:predicted transposase YdaD
VKIDATLRNMFFRPPTRLVSMILGVPVTVKAVLPTDLVTVKELRPDLLYLLGDDELVHAEMHGYWMEDFPLRNLQHWTIIYEQYKRAPRQVVVWVGNGKPVKPGLSFPPHLEYSYEVIDARDLDPEELLAGDVDEAIFAVLCKIGNGESERKRIVTRILARIEELPLEQRRDALLRLLILSGMRGLTALVRKEAEHMPLTIDIHENEFLEDVFQDGKKAGRDEGRREAARELLLTLLERKFGPVPAAIRHRVEGADMADVTRWSQNVLGATSADQALR